MKIVYTGGEFLLSAYLNCLKIPLVVFFVILVFWTLIAMDDGIPFKETFLYRHRYWLGVLAALTNLYLFVFWN